MTASKPTAHNRIVMLVTDSLETAVMCKGTFQNSGCELICESPIYAIQTQAVLGAALVIIDANLSHINRIQLCAELRGKSTCPILMLVPEYNGNQVIDVYNAGADECLLTPISPAFLVIKAISWLMRRRWVGDNACPIQVMSGFQA